MHNARITRIVALTATLLVVAIGFASTLALDESAFADPTFARTWNRTDKPVEAGEVSRSWIWGDVLSAGKQEPYVESPDDERLVQYFDKARMEITNPNAVDDGMWFVTTGLLVNELISGLMQVGDTTFLEREPADISIAGDPNNDGAPTYADLPPFLTAPARADGEVIIERMNGAGELSNDPSLAMFNVTAAERVQAPEIDHRVASVFWEFMNSSGAIWDGEEFTDAALFPNPFYATGFPVTEAYWSEVRVAGITQDVLWQCFQRRCLTYTPGNAEGWKVEVGNVGRHYFLWRYGDIPGVPTPTSSVPEPTATSTAVPTATSTPVPTTDQLFAAFLSSANELNDVDSDASGTAWFHVSADGSTVRYQITVADIENITAAHIHLGDAGDEGPVVVTLFDGKGAAVTPPRLLVEGEFDAGDLDGPLEDEPLATLLNALATGDAYVNVHTSQHSRGEMRGQIAVGDELLLRADLTGNQQPQPVNTEARATGLFYYDAGAGTLDYQLRVTDLDDPTAAHIHAGDPGEDGPVVAPLFSSDATEPVEDGALATGVITADDLQGQLGGATLARLVYEMVTGHAYVNIHTAAHPSGELRGVAQRWAGDDDSIIFSADLRGNNETDPVLTDAGGAALFRWDTDGDLFYELIVSDLDDPTAAHIHIAPEGEDGPVAVTLFLGGDDQGERNGVIADGTIGADTLSGPLDDRPLQRLIYELATGGAYVNVHTPDNSDGEIRGQSTLVAAPVWVAHLDGFDEDPPVSTTAEGVAIFELSTSGETMRYRVIVSDLEDATQANLHMVTNNGNGPVVVELWEESAAFPATSNGLLIDDWFDEANFVGPLTGSEMSMLLEQIPEAEVYTNITTEEHAFGEIRGTLE